MSLKTYKITGKARYAKVLGKAPPGYDNGPAEWTVDLILDEAGKKEYLTSGGDKFYVKVNKDTGEEYIKFTRKALKSDNTDAKPIEVVGPDTKPWDQKTLIGNGSTLVVKFCLNEAKHKNQKRLKPYILGIQVWEHVPYVPKSDFAVKDTNILSTEGVTQAW